MEHKRLRSSKNIKSLSVARLSNAAKEQLGEAVYTQFLETMKIPEEYKETSKRISTMGYYILKIGHDFNEYCEAVSGSGKISPVKTEICEFVSDICVKSEEFVKRKNIEMVCKIPRENIIVQIDREKFCFAFLNVILNAAENTPAKGKIRISISRTKKFVKIVTADNGLGMDEECLSRCFEPFYTKQNFHGKNKMGLGLTLARNFVTESGGRIKITSEKGKGTSVSMLLPLFEGETNISVGSIVPEIPGGKFSPVEIVLSALCED